jgi:hypothetical protein
MGREGPRNLGDTSRTQSEALEFLSQSELEFAKLFDTVLDRWDLAEGIMGSMVVVAVQPIGRQVTYFLQ